MKKNVHLPTYGVWCNMIARCDLVSHPKYKYYGGRGITVCKEWYSYSQFLADMGEKPDSLSLDRKDNNGNYVKSNCRWATSTEQRKNQRNPNTAF
jgi:hypothetical protein